jgi:putative tricarboxylic transport membrane protein
LLFNFKEFCLTFWTMVRSAVAGFVIGTLPGAGATIASAMTYMSEKRMAGDSGTFGEGDLRGLAAPEAANNASACGSLIPMLTLGVPGSGTTAVMIGALTLYNITPGPLLFEQQPDVVWGLLVMNIPLVGLFSRMLSVPNWVLVPAITAISLVGVYSVHSTTFDLVLMIGLGVFGYLLRKLDFPLSSLILGFVLGEMMEDNLRRALSISAGDLGILWSSPITLTLWAMAILMLALPGLRWWRQRRRARLNAAHA